MIKDVAENMHTFFVPQMEQLKLKERPAKYGSLSIMDSESGTGMLWALSIGDGCLFTFHDVVLNDPKDLVEYPDDYICITSMNQSSAKLCPINSSHLRNRNVISFKQDGGEVSFTLEPGERHRSYTLCMTPAFFDSLDGIKDGEKEALASYLSKGEANALPKEVGRALESIGPSWAMRPGGNMFVEAKMKEVVACALATATKGFKEGLNRLPCEYERIAQEAKAIMDSRYSEDLTLQTIANELYVGKTTLCQAFRKQVGCSVADYLKERRMSEARLLLETTDMTAAEIGFLVGYAHPSSFTTAFRKAHGCSPSQWRGSLR